jgi:hypothetical protein
MNKSLLIIILSLLISVAGFAQEKKHMGHKRLEELEKLKLIEVLNMNEETTLKFFARRNAHKDKMEELNDKLSDKAAQIEKMIKENAEKSKLKSAVKEYLDLEIKIPKERMDFVHSLSDILNDEQMAKFVIFEKTFREEIKDIIFRERRKNMKNSENQ